MSHATLAEPEAPSRFLSLPAELRLMIYSFAWGNTGLRLRTTKPRGMIYAMPKSRPKLVGNTYGKLPRWLLASKQICDEAINVLGEDFIVILTSECHLRYTRPNGLLIPYISTIVLCGYQLQSCHETNVWNHDAPEFLYEGRASMQLHDDDKDASSNAMNHGYGHIVEFHVLSMNKLVRDLAKTKVKWHDVRVLLNDPNGHIGNNYFGYMHETKVGYEAILAGKHGWDIDILDDAWDFTEEQGFSGFDSGAKYWIATRWRKHQDCASDQRSSKDSKTRH